MDDRERMEKFLAGPELADLVTLMPDGSPHVAPVWYSYRDGIYLVLAEAETVKIRNIRRDPRVAISIAKRESPYAYVLVRGTAQLSVGDTDPLLFELSYRYLGETEGKVYAEQVRKDCSFVLITVTPHTTSTYFND